MKKVICYGMTELSLSVFRANTDQEEKAAETAYDEAQKAIEADYLPFFSALVSGEIDYFQYETGKNCHLFTRSARTGVAVQMTIFWNRDGELLPLSHRNINSFADMVRKGIADNVTITAA